MPRNLSASLDRVPVIACATETGRAWFARTCIWHQRKAGTRLIDSGDASRDVFFLVSGRARAKVYAADGRTVIFHDLSAGEMFGELAAIDGQPRSASIEAVESCTAASLTAAQFEAFLAREPAVAWAVLRLLAATVRRLSERVHEFSTLVVQNRIQAELLRLATIAGSGDAAAARLSPAPTLADIADRVATHREAVSRELSRLAALGLVRREGRNLVLTDVPRLAALVREAKGE